MLLSCCAACGKASSPSEGDLGHTSGNPGLGGAAGAAVLEDAGETGTDDLDPSPAQAVVWFGLAPAQGANCSSTMTYQAPDDARETILGNSGAGDRVIDGGENSIVCTVQPLAGSEGTYDVSLKFQAREIANFVATGRLTESSPSTPPNTVDLYFVTGQFSLSQQKCTTQVRVIVPGAIWISDLHCGGLRDPSVPGVSCDGRGGLIFEECSR